MSLQNRSPGADGFRTRFREWCHGRPVLGGVLLLLAGAIIGWVPLQFAGELVLVGGALTFSGLLFATAVGLMGVFVLLRPDLSTMLGTVGVVMSVLSLFGALGGLLVGMLVGIVGGNLCIAWVPPDDVDTDREGGR